MGKHATIVGTGGVHNIFKVLYILEITYAITMCLVKYSILCFYWRIFKVTQYRIPFYIMFGVVTAWFIAAVNITGVLRNDADSVVGARCDS